MYGMLAVSEVERAPAENQIHFQRRLIMTINKFHDRSPSDSALGARSIARGICPRESLQTQQERDEKTFF